MYALVLIISWFPVLLGGLVLLPPIQTGEANMVYPMALLLSRRVPGHAMPDYVRRIPETCAVLRAVSVTISFDRIIRCA